MIRLTIDSSDLAIAGITEDTPLEKRAHDLENVEPGEVAALIHKAAQEHPCSIIRYSIETGGRKLSGTYRLDDDTSSANLLESDIREMLGNDIV